VICVLTHDSLGVGEDGPTHRPIEDLVMVRGASRCAAARQGSEISLCVEAFDQLQAVQ